MNLGEKLLMLRYKSRGDWAFSGVFPDWEKVLWTTYKLVVDELERAARLSPSDEPVFLSKYSSETLANDDGIKNKNIAFIIATKLTKEGIVAKVVKSDKPFPTIEVTLPPAPDFYDIFDELAAKYSE